MPRFHPAERSASGLRVGPIMFLWFPYNQQLAAKILEFIAGENIHRLGSGFPEN